MYGWAWCGCFFGGSSSELLRLLDISLSRSKSRQQFRKPARSERSAFFKSDVFARVSGLELLEGGLKKDWRIPLAELTERGWRLRLRGRQIEVLRKGQEEPRADANVGY